MLTHKRALIAHCRLQVYWAAEFKSSRHHRCNTKAAVPLHRWFNGMQLASLVGSLGLCYWQFKAKKANAMDSALPVFASSGMV